MKRNPRRSDEEWLAIIHKCRTSGFSDKVWCKEHNIRPGQLYYHIRRLREKGCEIPEREKTALVQPVQEVVPILLETTDTKEITYKELTNTVITIRINGICLDITNGAAKDTIANTLSALQGLC